MPEIDTIREKVMDILHRVSGIPRDEIDLTTSFDDLEVDSLSRIELLVELEREFDVTTPDDQEDGDLVNAIQSVEAAARLVETNLQSQA